MLASLGTGGRFNPAGEFGALYVSLDPDTPLRELHRQASKAGLDVLAFLPRTLFAMEARLQHVLDLTCLECVAEYGLTDALLAADDWRACQEAARRARQEGFEAVRFPSATGSGENLAVFADRLLDGSFIRILQERELRP